MYKAYVDGRSENGKGAWAFMLLNENNEVMGGLSGQEKNDSSNRMGLVGAIHLFNYLEEKGIVGEAVEIYTDCNYLRRGITEWIEGWMAPDEKGQTWTGARGKAIKYKELWIKLYDRTLKYTLNWDWVLSSIDNKYNDRTDHYMHEIRLKVSNMLQAELNYAEAPLDDDIEISVDDVLDYMFGNDSNPEAEKNSISKIEKHKKGSPNQSHPWDGILLHPIKSLYDRFYAIPSGRGYVLEKVHIDLHWLEVTLECDPYNADSIANAAQDTSQILLDVYQSRIKDNSIEITEIIIENDKIKCVMWVSVNMNYDSLSPQEKEMEEEKVERR